MNTLPIDLLETPAAVIDLSRMLRNIARMQQRADDLGVAFRPHVKTSKCTEVVARQTAAGARGITVSTLKEAREFFAAGVSDILYAVGMVATKLPAALALRRSGCGLQIITDSVAAAEAIVAFGKAHAERFEVLIEIDTDSHRSGVKPDEPVLFDIARTLHDGGMVLAGVLTHAGSSYDHDTPDALVAVAEKERAGVVRAAQRLREAGLPCPVVSLGSTPTALMTRGLEGVTELRAGVYVFFDLVMTNVGVCTTDDLALSVLTTVIGHQVDKGLAVLDAGWMAMSRDRGTAKQKIDYGYGQVCDVDGTVVPGYILGAANQEHGLLCRAASKEGTAGLEATDPNPVETDIAQRFPIGTRLRILPNHACATGAQFAQYHALADDGQLSTWSRFSGW